MKSFLFKIKYIKVKTKVNPDYVSIKRFMELFNLGRSTINEDIKKGLIESRYYRSKLMINIAKFNHDLHQRMFEKSEKFTNLD